MFIHQVLHQAAVAQARGAVGHASDRVAAGDDDGGVAVLAVDPPEDAQHVVTLAALGVRRFTISPEVISELFTDEFAAAAVDAFEAHMTDVL